MAVEKPDIAVLLLAAGESSRMGQPKQLLLWKGKTLLEHAIRVAHASKAKKIIVVVGAGADHVIKGTLPGAYEVVFNEDWRSGMGSSIAAGMRHLQASEQQWDAVLITLADQPLIDSGYLNKLIESYTEKGRGIVATKYGASLGVPAIFAQKYFAELRALKGRGGAKSLLKKYAEDAISLDPGPKSLDIDTPEDYRGLQQK